MHVVYRRRIHFKNLIDLIVYSSNTWWGIPRRVIGRRPSAQSAGVRKLNSRRPSAQEMEHKDARICRLAAPLTETVDGIRSDLGNPTAAQPYDMETWSGMLMSPGEDASAVEAVESLWPRLSSSGSDLRLSPSLIHYLELEDVKVLTHIRRKKMELFDFSHPIPSNRRGRRRKRRMKPPWNRHRANILGEALMERRKLVLMSILIYYSHQGTCWAVDSSVSRSGPTAGLATGTVMLCRGMPSSETPRS